MKYDRPRICLLFLSEFTRAKCVFGETYGETKYRLSMAKGCKHSTGAEPCQYRSLTICSRPTWIVASAVRICMSSGGVDARLAPCRGLTLMFAFYFLSNFRKSRQPILDTHFSLQWHTPYEPTKAFIQHFGAVLQCCRINCVSPATGFCIILLLPGLSRIKF